MTRCLACNGILKAGESTCYACGDEVPKAVAANPWNKKFSFFINCFFVASLLLTVASFFTDRTPPFSICIAVSVILLFVKRSADQLREKKT